jgi:hypothetical protein
VRSPKHASTLLSHGHDAPSRNDDAYAHDARRRRRHGHDALLHACRWRVRSILWSVSLSGMMFGLIAKVCFRVGCLDREFLGTWCALTMHRFDGGSRDFVPPRHVQYITSLMSIFEILEILMPLSEKFMEGNLFFFHVVLRSQDPHGKAGDMGRPGPGESTRNSASDSHKRPADIALLEKIKGSRFFKRLRNILCAKKAGMMPGSMDDSLAHASHGPHLDAAMMNHVSS